MTTQEAIKILEEVGYIYYFQRMVSGYEFDNPEGETIHLTDGEIVKLANNIS